jgi:hypothetical protein
MSNGEIREFDALTIPNDALEKGGVEILRASIVEGELHLTLRRAFEQPEKWGGILSETITRIARVYAAADKKFDEKDVTARIRTSLGGVGVSASAAKKTKPKSKKKSPAKKAARKRKKR